MQTPSRQRHRFFLWRLALATCLPFGDAFESSRVLRPRSQPDLSRLDSRQGLCRHL